jgi:hypothetical protein
LNWHHESLPPNNYHLILGLKENFGVHKFQHDGVVVTSVKLRLVTQKPVLAANKNHAPMTNQLWRELRAESVGSSTDECVFLL